MLAVVGEIFPKQDILIVTDSWFGNQGLWKPLRKKLGKWAHLLSRLRANNNLYELPGSPLVKRAGRPAKYGQHLGTTTSLAKANRARALEMIVNLYGRLRTVLACEQIVMQKTLKCRFGWCGYIAGRSGLPSSPRICPCQLPRLSNTTAQGGRSRLVSKNSNRISAVPKPKIESGGGPKPSELCMMATSLTWIYACNLNKTPSRRHAVKGRKPFRLFRCQKIDCPSSIG